MVQDTSLKSKTEQTVSKGASTILDLMVILTPQKPQGLDPVTHKAKYIRRVLKILHDPKYLIAGELWHCSMFKTCNNNSRSCAKEVPVWTLAIHWGCKRVMAGCYQGLDMEVPRIWRPPSGSKR